MTDMPLRCQSSSSPCACSNTSSGSIAGPGEKLKMRIPERFSGVGARVVRRQSAGLAVLAVLAVLADGALICHIGVPGQSVDALEPGELVALLEPYQAHPLSIAPDHGNILHRRTHQHAVLTHQHDLIVQAHLQSSYHPSVAVGDLQCNHALAAAAVLREIIERREFAEPVLRCGENEALLRHDQRIDALLVAQADAAHARRLAAHRTDLFLEEANRLAAGGEQQYILGAVGDRNTDQFVARLERDRDDAARPRPREQRQRGLLYGAEAGRHEDELTLFEFLDRQHGADALALLQGQEIHDGLAARAPARLRELINLQPIQLAAIRKTQQRVMGVRDEQLVDEILVLDAGGGLAAAAAALRLVVGYRLRLGVTAMGQGHDHILRRDQILRREILVIDEDFSAPLVAEGVADIFELVANHFEQTLRPGQNI